MSVIKLFDRGVQVGDILTYNNSTGVKTWFRPSECISGVPSGYTSVGVCFHRDNALAKVINKTSGGSLQYKTSNTADGTANSTYKKKTGLVTNYQGLLNIDRGYAYWSTRGITPTADVPIINGANDDPVNESSFNASSYCKLLRQTYNDYRTYLTENYGIKYPQTYGCFGLPDGKTITYAYNDSVHPAFQHCAGVKYQINSTDIDGIGAGDWWMPGVKEGVELMKDVTLAKVNASLTLISGATVSDDSTRWFAQRCSDSSAWIFGGGSGALFDRNFTSAFSVQAVTLFNVR